MQQLFKKIQSGKTFYLFAAFLPVTILAFWNTYFSGIFLAGKSYSFYFHFHTAMALSWLCLLIVQPYLFRIRKYQLHRQTGRLTYVLFPALLLSVLLLAHNRYTSAPTGKSPIQLLIPLKDIMIALYGYLIAVYYRNNIPLHVRGMLITGIVFVEPVLIRVFSNYVTGYPYSMYLVMAVIYGILSILMISERKLKKGKWVFPPVFVFYVLMHIIILAEWVPPFLKKFAGWFSSIPLT